MLPHRDPCEPGLDSWTQPGAAAETRTPARAPSSPPPHAAAAAAAAWGSRRRGSQRSQRTAEQRWTPQQARSPARLCRAAPERQMRRRGGADSDSRHWQARLTLADAAAASPGRISAAAAAGMGRAICRRLSRCRRRESGVPSQRLQRVPQWGAKWQPIQRSLQRRTGRRALHRWREAAAPDSAPSVAALRPPAWHSTPLDLPAPHRSRVRTCYPALSRQTLARLHRTGRAWPPQKGLRQKWHLCNPAKAPHPAAAIYARRGELRSLSRERASPRG